MRSQSSSATTGRGGPLPRASTPVGGWVADGEGRMRATWIGGWGVSPERWPRQSWVWAGAEPRVLTPVAGVAEKAAGSDWIVAWSFGAWRILEAAARGLVFKGRVTLLAPFVAFGAEYGLGGRCSVTQVRWLRRWLVREPGRALADFYQRSGLEGAPEQLPYALTDLLEGLDRLAEDASPRLRSFAARGLPSNWEAVIGGADPLLEAGLVQTALPGCRIVAGAGHAAEELMAAVEAGSNAV